MKAPKITKEKIKSIYENKYLNFYDIQYEEGRHYLQASRRDKDGLVAIKTKEEYSAMLPDAVTCVVVVEIEGKEPALLLAEEFRYPAGRFLISPPAGVIDPQDRTKERQEAIITTAIREMHEETGLVVSDDDRVEIISPLLFSTPGMTDESNALVLVVKKLKDTSELTQDNAEGSECFDGFSLVDKAAAKKMLKEGVDSNGGFYSVYTWCALMYFVSDMWKE